MVIRIVRMHFIPEKEVEFLEIFNRNKEAIRYIDGCTHLELLKDANTPCTYATVSHWQSEADLENYRKSPLFGNIWTRVKTMFSDRAQAFSMEKFIEV